MVFLDVRVAPRGNANAGRAEKPKSSASFTEVYSLPSAHAPVIHRQKFPGVQGARDFIVALRRVSGLASGLNGQRRDD